MANWKIWVIWILGVVMLLAVAVTGTILSFHEPSVKEEKNSTAREIKYLYSPSDIVIKGSGLVLLVGVLLWPILSIKIVGPDEMAVRVIFGEPVGFCKSGFRLVPFLPGLDCYLRRYPQKMYNFSYQEHEVITKAGVYSAVSYGSQVLRVDSVAYLNFPRESDPDFDAGSETHPLVKILRASVPIDEAKLMDWTEEVVVGALRVALGKMTWKEAVEDLAAVNREVEEVFKKADGALLRAGFRPKGIKLIIEEIKLPQELKDALPGPDKARLLADAAESSATAKAIEIVGPVLATMARVHKKTVDQIREMIEGNETLQKEFREYVMKVAPELAKADRKAYFEFSTPNAGGTSSSILSLIALWQRMAGGVQNQNPVVPNSVPVSPSVIKPGKNPEDMTDEEAEEWAQKGRKKKKED